MHTSPQATLTLSLHDALPIFDRPNLSFDVVPLEGTGSKARKHMLLSAALADEANRPSIVYCGTRRDVEDVTERLRRDRKSTRLNSSHQIISYAVFCLKKKNIL